MKPKKNERINYDWYGSSDNWHRIDGPAFIEYKTNKKKEICLVSYWLYHKRFQPWWTT